MTGKHDHAQLFSIEMGGLMNLFAHAGLELPISASQVARIAATGS
jgi:hypothetical protein